MYSIWIVNIFIKFYKSLLKISYFDIYKIEKNKFLNLYLKSCKLDKKSTNEDPKFLII